MNGDEFRLTLNCFLVLPFESCFVHTAKWLLGLITRWTEMNSDRISIVFLYNFRIWSCLYTKVHFRQVWAWKLLERGWIPLEFQLYFYTFFESGVVHTPKLCPYTRILIESQLYFCTTVWIFSVHTANCILGTFELENYMNGDEYR